MKLKEAVGKKFWLSEDELHDALNDLEGWKLKDDYIVRVHEFEGYPDITKWILKLAALIKKENHHPDFTLDTKNKRVFIKLRSYNQNAITKYDTDFAKKINKFTK